jgi:hypothetical protein
MLGGNRTSTLGDITDDKRRVGDPAIVAMVLRGMSFGAVLNRRRPYSDPLK